MDHIQKSIETLVEKIREQENELLQTKHAVNALRAVLKQPPLYTDLDADKPAASLNNLRGDEFYGQPLSTVVRRILEARKAAGDGAASVNEIYDSMVAGGFKFETNNEDNAKRSLRISLTKNSQAFHKLPNGKYGMREWYPGIKDKPKAAEKDDQKDDDEDMFDMEAKDKVGEKISELLEGVEPMKS